MLLTLKNKLDNIIKNYEIGKVYFYIVPEIGTRSVIFELEADPERIALNEFNKRLSEIDWFSSMEVTDIRKI